MLLLKSVGQFIMRNLTYGSLLHFSSERQQSEEGQTGSPAAAPTHSYFSHVITEKSHSESRAVLQFSCQTTNANFPS